MPPPQPARGALPPPPPPIPSSPSPPPVSVPGVGPAGVFAASGEQRADPRTILTRVLPLVTVVTSLNLLGGVQLGALVFYPFMAGVVALVEWAQWANRWYEVTDAELRMRWGILSRDQRVVPFSRIQQVEHNQKLVHQILGLAVVKIETAAEAGTTSVQVDALPVAEAERLRAHLLERRRAVRAAAAGATVSTVGPWALAGALNGEATRAQVAPVTDDPIDEPAEVLTLDDAQLAIAGASGAGLLLGIVWMAWLWAFLLDNAEVLPRWMVDRAADGASTVVADPVAVVSITVGAVAVLPVVAALGSVVRWHGYRLAASRDDLLVRHGLFEVRRLTIPRRRIQHVTIADNPLRRRLGYVSMSLQSAASGAAGTNVLQVPLVRREQAEELLAQLMREDRWRPGPVDPRPPAALRRAIVRRCAVLALVAAPVAVMVRPAGVAALLVVPLGVPWGRSAHRRAGFGAANGTATITKGAFVYSREMVALERLQSARTSSSPLQRRVGLATLALDVAGSRFAPHLGDIDVDLGTMHRRGLCRTVPTPASPRSPDGP